MLPNKTSIGAIMTDFTRTPELRFSTVLLCALSLSIGWGIRGNFGHEYGAMIPGLQAGRHDAVTAGLFMKPERCAAVAYSEPVLCDAEAMLVKKGNP